MNTLCFWQATPHIKYITWHETPMTDRPSCKFLNIRDNDDMASLTTNKRFAGNYKHIRMYLSGWSSFFLAFDHKACVQMLSLETMWKSYHDGYFELIFYALPNSERRDLNPPPHPFLQFYFQAISNFKIKLPKQRFEMKVIFLLFELLVLSSCQRFSRKTPMSCSPQRCRWTDQPVTVHFRCLYFIWGSIKETILISVITYFISFIQKIFKINVLPFIVV